MIKIIKSGKKEFHAICSNCGCEFTYEQEDLNGTGFINCPECNAIMEHSVKVRPTEIFYKDTTKDNMQSNNPCGTCSYYQRLKAGEIYVGDTPCTWCQHNPFRVTCTNVYTATNTNTDVTIDPGKAEMGGITFNNGKN